MKKILFVCTGNTCRSPMAEAIFNKLTENKGINYRADSCGIYTATGIPASENSRLACGEIGIDLKNFRSTALDDVNLDDYELVVCMTNSHKEILLNFGVPGEKLCVLKGDKDGISDPYGGNLGRYTICRDEIISAIDELILRLDSVLVRRLDVADSESVHKLIVSSFSNPWSRETVESMLQSEKSALFGAFIGEELVGFASLEWILDEGSLTEIAVRSEYRRQGIAQKLMEELLKVAEDNNFSFVTLEVRESNQPAISLYRKFGFKEVGLRKNYYKNPMENAVLMTK